MAASLIAIGDIHGCLDEVQALFAALHPGPDDHFIFLGDYIDRGPNAKGVLEFLIAFTKKHSCVFLRGNHEVMMLDYMTGATTGTWYAWHQSGGDKTVEGYRTEPGRPLYLVPIPEDHIRFVEQTVPYYETDAFFFVHAGLDPTKSIAQNKEAGDERVFFWERRHLDQAQHPLDALPWEKTVVCGHNIMREPLNHPKLLSIDTGVFLPYVGYNWGWLTAVRLPQREFVSVATRPRPSTIRVNGHDPMFQHRGGS